MTHEDPASVPFYLLSPDGFTLTRNAAPYTSIATAEQDFLDWKQQFETQGYYYSLGYGRIPLDQLHQYMIKSEHPYAI